MPATAVAEPQRDLVSCAPALPPVTGHTHDVEGPDCELVSLVRRAAGGDERAWERLYDRFTPTCAPSHAATGCQPATSTTSCRRCGCVSCSTSAVCASRWRSVGGWRRPPVASACACIQLPLREYPTDDPGLGDVAQVDRSRRRDAGGRAAGDPAPCAGHAARAPPPADVRARVRAADGLPADQREDVDSAWKHRSDSQPQPRSPATSPRAARAQPDEW